MNTDNIKNSDIKNSDRVKLVFAGTITSFVGLLIIFILFWTVIAIPIGFIVSLVGIIWTTEGIRGKKILKIKLYNKLYNKPDER